VIITINNYNDIIRFNLHQSNPIYLIKQINLNFINRGHYKTQSFMYSYLFNIAKYPISSIVTLVRQNLNLVKI